MKFKTETPPFFGGCLNLNKKDNKTMWNTLAIGKEFSTKLEIERLKKKIIKNELKLNILKRNLKELENKKTNKGSK